MRTIAWRPNLIRRPLALTIDDDDDDEYVIDKHFRLYLRLRTQHYNPNTQRLSVLMPMQSKLEHKEVSSIISSIAHIPALVCLMAMCYDSHRLTAKENPETKIFCLSCRAFCAQWSDSNPKYCSDNQVYSIWKYLCVCVCLCVRQEAREVMREGHTITIKDNSRETNRRLVTIERTAASDFIQIKFSINVLFNWLAFCMKKSIFSQLLGNIE